MLMSFHALHPSLPASSARYASAMKKAAAATFVILALLLTGCAAAENEAEQPTPSATPTPTPTSAVGDVIDADTAAELNEAKGDERGYPMPDGTFILVSKAAPLPDAVQADVNAKGTAHTQAFPAVSAEPGVNGKSERERALVMGDIAMATGKQVVYGMKLAGYLTSDASEMTTYYFFNGAFSSPEPRYYTKADAEAAVNAWLATKENPYDYVVVWGD